MTKRERKTPVQPKKSKKANTPAQRETKQRRMIEMLRRPQGASIEQMAHALGWQSHTVRGAISGALKKKLGLAVSSTKEKHGRIYRIVDIKAAKRA